METTLADSFIDHEFPSKAQSFLIANGIHHSVAGIEMVALQPLTYTSLKDLLPEPVIVSPVYDRGDSWREIPIKDPLLQHAAWAYIHLSTMPSKVDDRSCAAKVKDGCLGLFECLGGLFNDVVRKMVKWWFLEDESVGEHSSDSLTDH